MIKIVITKTYFAIFKIKMQIHNFSKKNISNLAKNYLNIGNYTILGMIWPVVKKALWVAKIPKISNLPINC